MYLFSQGEQVICISNRKSCCRKLLTNIPRPEIGDIYLVLENIEGICFDCLELSPCIKIKGLKGDEAWPQECFKRVPPKVDIKETVIHRPEAVDA